MKTVVIIGRPNVGKSLLFNRLLRQRCALVYRQPGMTLDFLRERLPLAAEQAVWLVDTGGIGGDDEWSAVTERQMRLAAAQADLFLFVVDYRSGLTAGDNECARFLRRQNTPWWLVINKAEHTEAAVAAAEFHSLGAATMVAVSAKAGSGLEALRQRLMRQLCTESETAAAPPALPTAAVVGRPNVGKSTLINRLLGEERLVVSDTAGTTRDNVACALEHADGGVVFVDTAGMRRRPPDEEKQRLSLAASRRALAAADCAIFMVDIAAGVTYQDKRIAALIEESGCAAVLVANKADLLPAAVRRRRLADAAAALPLAVSLPAFALSALGRRALPLRGLLAAVRKVTAAAYRQLPTALLNDLLADIVAAQSPRQRGRIRPKLRYAHQGGSRPPCVVIHGNAVGRIDASYRRYLATAFARRLALPGNQIKVVLRGGKNPYQPE